MNKKMQQQYDALGEYFRGPGQPVYRGAATYDEDAKLHALIHDILAGLVPDPRAGLNTQGSGNG